MNTITRALNVDSRTLSTAQGINSPLSFGLNHAVAHYRLNGLCSNPGGARDIPEPAYAAMPSNVVKRYSLLYVKVGRLVKYSRHALDRFIDANPVQCAEAA